MASSLSSSRIFTKDQLYQVEHECNKALVYAHDIVERVWKRQRNAAYCAGVWDGLACWPPTLAGQNAAQPCQRYLEGHHSMVGCHGSATRYCTSAGEWFVHPATRTAWTNYSACMQPENYVAETTTTISTLLRLEADDVVVAAPDEISQYVAAAAGRTPSDILGHEMRTTYLSHIQAISIMSSIGYLTSLVLLLIALGILIAVRRLKSPRNKLLINLSASFMLRATVIIMIRYLPLERWAREMDLSNMFSIRAEVHVDGGNDSYAVQNDSVTFNVMYPHACLQADRTTPNISSLWTVCKFGELVKHYSLLANYFWILMEGFYLNNILTFALFSEHSWLYAYICGGWLPPAIFVGIWATFKSVYANDPCWHTEVYNDPHFWIIRGPITAAIFLSFVVFVNILRIVCTKLAGTREIDQSLQTPIKRRYAKLAKSFLCLIPLCGTHYVLTLTLADIKNPRTQVVWLFIEQLFTSFQGAFVALIYIFMSGDVRREIHRALTRRRSSKFKDVRSRGNNGCAKGGGGARKRSAPHNNNAGANHHQLRQLNSSPLNGNCGHAINFQQVPPPYHPLSPMAACVGADGTTFKLKPIYKFHHRFHPMLSKKSLTLTTLINNSGGNNNNNAAITTPIRNGTATHAIRMSSDNNGALVANDDVAVNGNALIILDDEGCATAKQQDTLMCECKRLLALSEGAGATSHVIERSSGAASQQNS